MGENKNFKNKKIMRKLILCIVPIISFITSFGSWTTLMGCFSLDIPLRIIVLSPTIVFILGLIFIGLALKDGDSGKDYFDYMMIGMFMPLMVNSFFIFWIKLLADPGYPWWCVVINNIPSWIILSCFK